MFERFTDRARKVFQLANQEAQRFGAEYIHPAHVVIAMMKEGSGVAHRVLTAAGLDIGRVRLVAERSLPPGVTEPPVIGKLPHTPGAKLIVEQAVAAARERRHDWVGTEHLLLGALEVRESVELLAACGVNVGTLGAAVDAMMADGRSPAPNDPTPGDVARQTRAAILRELAFRLLAEADSLGRPGTWRIEPVGDEARAWVAAVSADTPHVAGEKPRHTRRPWEPE